MVLTFVFGYAVPLVIVGVLLGVTLMFWLSRPGNVPLFATSSAVVDATQTAAVGTGIPGRHATPIVVAVVVVFAILQLPLQVHQHC